MKRIATVDIQMRMVIVIVRMIVTNTKILEATTLQLFSLAGFSFIPAGLVGLVAHFQRRLEKAESRVPLMPILAGAAFG